MVSCVYHHCSLWGKFAQRDNMKKVKYITDPADFFDVLSNDGVEVKCIDSVSAQMVRVEYSNAAHFVEEQANVNVAIAAYTTAYGRLELYSYLERLGERVLYFDTGQSRLILLLIIFLYSFFSVHFQTLITSCTCIMLMFRSVSLPPKQIASSS